MKVLIKSCGITLLLQLTCILQHGYCQHHSIDSLTGNRMTVILQDSGIRQSTRFWKSIVDPICKNANIAVFDSTVRSFHFRLYGSTQILDIHEVSPARFSGMLFQWTNESVPDGESPTNRVFCLQRPLTDDQIANVLNLYRTSGMDTLRHQEKIAGWSNGLDGIIYLVESIDDKKYQFRTYWTPSSTSTIAEERLVYHFVDSCFVLAGNDALQAAFQRSLPFYSWENGEGTMTSRVVTWRKYKEMKRERARYRKSLKSSRE